MVLVRCAVGKRIAQLCASTSDPAAHGAELDPQHLRDLLVAHSLDIAEHNGNTLLGFQSRQRLSHVSVQGTVRVKFFRAAVLTPDMFGR